MTPDDRDDDLRRLWKSQANELPGVSLDLVRTRSRALERSVRRRNAGEYAAALIVVAIVLPWLWRAPNLLIASGGALVLAAVAFVTYRLHAMGSARPLPADLGARSSLELHRADLERQRDLLKNVWTWYLLPFWPGMGLVLLGATIERPERWPWAVGMAALAVAMAFQIAWMNTRSATMLQERIDALEENPVTALQSGPPSLTLAQRLSVWFVTSFLGATAAGFVMGRVFPEWKAEIFGLGALPAPTRDVVFVLVLIVAGVAIQALWWMLRRR